MVKHTEENKEKSKSYFWLPASLIACFGLTPYGTAAVYMGLYREPITINAIKTVATLSLKSGLAVGIACGATGAMAIVNFYVIYKLLDRGEHAKAAGVGVLTSTGIALILFTASIWNFVGWGLLILAFAFAVYSLFTSADQPKKIDFANPASETAPLLPNAQSKEYQQSQVYQYQG